MLVAKSLCWRLFYVMLVIFSMYKIGHQHPESVIIISNLSPTHLVSNIYHQYSCHHSFLVLVKFSLDQRVKSKGRNELQTHEMKKISDKNRSHKYFSDRRRRRTFHLERFNLFQITFIFKTRKELNYFIMSANYLRTSRG